jgi:hypothetical protein
LRETLEAAAGGQRLPGGKRLPRARDGRSARRRLGGVDADAQALQRFGRHRTDAGVDGGARAGRERAGMADGATLLDDATGGHVAKFLHSAVGPMDALHSGFIADTAADGQPIAQHVRAALYSGQIPPAQWTAAERILNIGAYADTGAKGGSAKGARKLRGGPEYYRWVVACREAARTGQPKPPKPTDAPPAKLHQSGRPTPQKPAPRRGQN